MLKCQVMVSDLWEDAILLGFETGGVPRGIVARLQTTQKSEQDKEGDNVHEMGYCLESHSLGDIIVRYGEFPEILDDKTVKEIGKRRLF